MICSNCKYNGTAYCENLCPLRGESNGKLKADSGKGIAYNEYKNKLLIKK